MTFHDGGVHVSFSQALQDTQETVGELTQQVRQAAYETTRLRDGPSPMAQARRTITHGRICEDLPEYGDLGLRRCAGAAHQADASRLTRHTAMIGTRAAGFAVEPVRVTPMGSPRRLVQSRP